ncbi:MAG: aminotransferase class V-fold PLP-dependent enzyme [Rhodospirillaceae bacterium]|jgi:alanine-glyoxylate transaminase / serine-glyoxylate transaminase / serine-pyruvate transaminase|nr:aminotransferase class V-fold PLP-dependent enzyme [Rhodospirillaceae bacterium]
MTVQRGWNFLQTPGPTNIPNRVLNAMHTPAVEFAGPEFQAFCTSLFTDLTTLFKTDGRVFIYAANGHGAWEAALTNSLSPGDKVLIPETGRFGLSWGDMGRTLQIEPEILPNDWRSAIDPADVEARLSADTNHEIKAVLLVHTDTATGITCDVAAVRAAMDAANHPALLMVDTIASLMTTDFRMDEWGVDVTVAAGQKGIMLPPGLAFCAVNEKALEVHKTSTMPRGYWDWTYRMNEEVFYMAFCGTAPEQLLFGLRAAIDMLWEEGFDNVFARHARLSSAVRAGIDTWAEAGALELFARNVDERSNAVTAILVDPAYDPVHVRNICRENFNLALGNGLGKVAKETFRIGHMGDLNEPMVFGTLASVEAGLKLAGVPYKSGGVEAAIEVLTAS